jgi:parvulin-like peptidyl-prolyl isomerase
MSLTINGELISDEAIEAEFRQIKGHYERSLQVACCERDPEFLGYAKDNLITRALMSQEAQRLFPQVPKQEILDHLVKLKEEAGGEREFHFRTGISAEEEDKLHEHIANMLRVDKLLAHIYGAEAEASPEQLEEHYQQHLNAFLSEEEVHVCHITHSMEGANSRAEVYERMRALRKELLAGADFMALAERECETADQQIDLGWFKRGSFMEEFETIAFSLQPKELSPVFTTQLGFHLCMVMERREPTSRPLPEVTDAVRSHWREHKRDALFNQYIDHLRTKATVHDTETHVCT